MIHRALPLLLMLGTAAVANDGLGSQLPRVPLPSADVADPLSEAITGLVAEVEDDLSDKDHLLDGAVTQDCMTRFAGGAHSWSVNWRSVEAIGPGDTFVFVMGPDVRLAIVGDASKPDQAYKLGALYAAMVAMQQRCRPAH